MARQFKRTIFIACEGSGTEPNYFESIRDIVISKGMDVMITIDPMPKNEREQQNEVRTGAKKRALRKINDEEEIKLKKYEIAEQYRAQPTRYVRTAQMRLEDESYDEVWAVFDKDGHPQHSAAFALAENKVNGKTVNIAFCSIAFEYWIVLHFEQLYYAFAKSQCRKGDLVLNCGTNANTDDCQGIVCVCGYLTAHNLMPEYEKGIIDLYHILAARLPIAIDNAAWLKKQTPIADIDKPLFDLNPYVNIDHIVYTLLHLQWELTWNKCREEVRTSDITFKIEQKANTLIILIRKNKPEWYILNVGSFLLSDSSGALHPLNERQIITDTEPLSIEFDINTLHNFSPVYILYNKIGNKYCIMDLC